jgi:hypothetical protein
MIVAFFQSCALPQLQATRALSGRSVPIIACGAAGAGFFIRYFGPESMGGAGDIGVKIDAEVARTGLSADEIGPKVIISYHASAMRIE